MPKYTFILTIITVVLAGTLLNAQDQPLRYDSDVMEMVKIVIKSTENPHSPKTTALPSKQLKSAHEVWQQWEKLKAAENSSQSTVDADTPIAELKRLTEEGNKDALNILQTRLRQMIVDKDTPVIMLEALIKIGHTDAQRVLEEYKKQREEDKRAQKDKEERAQKEKEKKAEAERKRAEEEQKRIEEEAAAKKRLAEEEAKRKREEQERKEMAEKDKPGRLETLTIEGEKWNFRWCPAGTFMMGTNDQIPDWKKQPGQGQVPELKHKVTLTKGFLIAETPTTQAQWAAVMGSNPSWNKVPEAPVMNVWWDDCQKFIAELNKLNVAPQGYEFTLPTETQWEYACRAGSTGDYCFGSITKNAPLSDYAFYGKKTISSPIGITDINLPPAGKGKPNVWGIHDMHGYVWEWCSDWYSDYPTEQVTDYTGPIVKGNDRVTRGGCWASDANNCRSARRMRGGDGDYSILRSNSGSEYTGFRVCLVGTDK